MTLLIDGDMVLYQATAAVEKEVRWDEVNHVLFSNSEEAWGAVEHILTNYREALKQDEVQIALSGSNNFRKAIAPTYKVKRAERKPLAYLRTMERMRETYKCLSVDTLEGDDVLGIWATNGKVKDPIIVSFDKDMCGVPCTLYNKGELKTITEDQADYFWLSQVLTGDAVDGYPGLPGCGPVKAAKILKDFDVGREMTYLEGLWAAVVKAYEAQGLDESDALIQCRLARILRASDWDSKKKEVRLWTPSV